MNKNTLLHRQIHSAFISGEKISHQAFLEGKVIIGSDAFTPKPKDNDQLSVYNGNKFSAEDAYCHYVEEIKLTSRGVLSITMEEVDSIDPLRAIADDHPFDGHAHIDFSQCPSNNQKKKRAAKLRDCAIRRGWSYVSGD